MPKHYKKIKRKGTPYKKKKTGFRKRRGLRQQIVPFTRLEQFAGNLRTLVTQDSWLETTTVTEQQGLVKTMVFQMDVLPGIAVDIPNLFKMYRINAVRIEMIPASTQVAAPNNSGLYLRMKPNRTGTVLTAANTLDEWNQNMAVKRFVIPRNRTTVLYMKLNQLVYTYRGSPLAPPGNFSYGVIKPKWIETTDLGCDHYGIDARIDTLSGENITDIEDGIAFTFIYKYYFQCKGVK